MRRRRLRSTGSPARRIIVRGLVVALLVMGLVYGLGFYRNWQLRDSCTGNAGVWNAELEQCTFRLALPEASTPDSTP